MKNIYVIHQLGRSHNNTEYATLAEAKEEYWNQVFLAPSEHNLKPIYICKAVMKFSPDQKTVIKGERLDK